jgi:periplasmic protein TonB
MNITRDNWNEIVFEYRNRDYGAFVLRRNYPFYLTVAALIVIVIFLSSMLFFFLVKGKHPLPTFRKVTVINYSELAPPPPIEKTYIPPKTITLVQKKIEKYMAPKVTAEEVKEEEQLPTIEEVKMTMDLPDSDAVEVQGSGEAQVEVAPPAQMEIVQIKLPEPEPDPTVKQPEFPGGDKALSKWLGSHLKYPAVATRMGIQGVVIVEFTIDIKGHVSDASVVQSLHRSCDDEALRLVNSMPKWTPGEANGKRISAKRKLPIQFTLS